MAKSVKAAAEALGVPLRRRSLQLLPQTVDKESGTVGMIVATETAAVQYIPDPAQTGDFDCRNYIKALEILDMAGVDFGRAPGMPFVDSHDTHTSIDRVLGSVLNLRVEGGQLVADAKFRQRYAELLMDIEDGHLQQVSVGYEVYEYEIVGVDEASSLPVVRAVRWCPHEVSSVAVGADAGATMRSQRSTETLFPAPVFKKRSAIQKRSQEKKSMADDIETLVNTAEDAVAAADIAIAALADVTDDGASDEVKSRLAALRARADGDTDPDKDPDTDTDPDGDTDAEKKEDDVTRAIAKKRGKDAVEFVESLRGLKRGMALREALSAYVQARAIASLSGGHPALRPFVDKVEQKRASKVAEILNPSALLARRKRGYVAAK
ncbi:hypothetical protein MOV66_10210 [Agrobacterium sp. SHOUNA12C]|nr:hypothetical protein [Agrobacterium sp. BETTINA12B]MCJ9757016.1 hypothetical protein [Agrobacterium sp. SHOUNA12C]